MPRKTFNVWSVDSAERRALVVDEGTKARAEESAARRNAAAKRFNVPNLVFLALPAGEEPDWKEIPV